MKGPPMELMEWLAAILLMMAGALLLLFITSLFFGWPVWR